MADDVVGWAGKGAGGRVESRQRGSDGSRRFYFWEPKRRTFNMTTGLDKALELTSTETLVIDILRQEGPLVFEALLERSGLEWPQMFSAVDDLTRSGKVWLQRGHGTDYCVALTGGTS
jgi:hypothetical protein